MDFIKDKKNQIRLTLGFTVILVIIFWIVFMVLKINFALAFLAALLTTTVILILIGAVILITMGIKDISIMLRNRK